MGCGTGLRPSPWSSDGDDDKYNEKYFMYGILYVQTFVTIMAVDRTLGSCLECSVQSEQ